MPTPTPTAGIPDSTSTADAAPTAIDLALLANLRADMAGVRSMLAALAERAEANQDAQRDDPTLAAEVIEALATKLLDREQRLATAFVSFTQSHAELGRRLDKLTASVEDLTAAVTAQTAEVNGPPPSLSSILKAVTSRGAKPRPQLEGRSGEPPAAAVRL